ncbi:MAG: hypothetical protein RQ922_04260 [Thermoproteota archaeon]|jgi:hypothetical protein|nr:hypothetical protein [Thermoproteota archaeon]
MRHLFGTLVGIFSIIDNEIGSSSIWVYLILIPLSHIIIFSLPNLICAIIIIIGAILLYSSEKGRVLAGGILVLVFSILSILFLFMTGLLLLSFYLILSLDILLGNVMSLVGGILALTWKPEKTSEQQFTVLPLPP